MYRDDVLHVANIDVAVTVRHDNSRLGAGGQLGGSAVDSVWRNAVAK